MATVAAKATNALVKRCKALTAGALKQPGKHGCMDYDDEADVLYMSFRRPQRATQTIETDGGILIRKDGRKVVGLTILNASQR